MFGTTASGAAQTIRRENLRDSHAPGRRQATPAQTCLYWHTSIDPATARDRLVIHRHLVVVCKRVRVGRLALACSALRDASLQ